MLRLRAGVATALAIVLTPDSSAVMFALRTAIASLLALFIAYFLELEGPYWAATTVLIVAQPMRGMVIAKSVNRVVGTLIGTAVAVALIAAFGQTPELFTSFRSRAASPTPTASPASTACRTSTRPSAGYASRSAFRSGSSSTECPPTSG
jgi:hypothetical protein